MGNASTFPLASYFHLPLLRQMRTFFHTVAVLTADCQSWDAETSADGESWQDVGRGQRTAQRQVVHWHVCQWGNTVSPGPGARAQPLANWSTGFGPFGSIAPHLLALHYIPCQHRLCCQDGINSLPRACAWRHDQSSLPLCPLSPQQIISPSLGGVVADVLRIIRPGFRLPFRLRPLQRVASPVWMWKLAAVPLKTGSVSIESFSESGTPTSILCPPKSGHSLVCFSFGWKSSLSLQSSNILEVTGLHYTSRVPFSEPANDSP
jgi:hypothetical protein